MYPILLGLHNLTRWLVLAAAIYAIVRMWRGWLGNGAWTDVDVRSGKVLVYVTTFQLLLGLLLYFVFSPITRGALSDFGGAMRDPAVRFYAVEHMVGMLVATALIHIGSARSRRAATDLAKFKTGAIFYTLALVAMLASIPWKAPFVPSF